MLYVNIATFYSRRFVKWQYTNGYFRDTSPAHSVQIDIQRKYYNEQEQHFQQKFMVVAG